jgi:rubrerythrin
MTLTAADTQSVMNALTIVAAEQQTMNFYMNVGNIPEDPLARGLYLEIAQIEEQHVSHYESILDPTLGWLTNLVLHEYNECWLYWSCMQTEPDNRIKALWELHLNMEIEHLRIACEMLRDIDGIEAESFLPQAGMPEPLTFESNKEYTELPQDHRYFDYQRVVNAGGAPSELVIERHREKFGQEYRLTTEGEHPVESLREDGDHDRYPYHQVVTRELEEV